MSIVFGALAEELAKELKAVNDGQSSFSFTNASSINSFIVAAKSSLISAGTLTTTQAANIDTAAGSTIQSINTSIQNATSTSYASVIAQPDISLVDTTAFAVSVEIGQGSVAGIAMPTVSVASFATTTDAVFNEFVYDVIGTMTIGSVGIGSYNLRAATNPNAFPETTFGNLIDVGDMQTGTLAVPETIPPVSITPFDVPHSGSVSVDLPTVSNTITGLNIVSSLDTDLPPSSVTVFATSVTADRAASVSVPFGGSVSVSPLYWINVQGGWYSVTVPIGLTDEIEISFGTSTLDTTTPALTTSIDATASAFTTGASFPILTNLQPLAAYPYNLDVPQVSLWPPIVADAHAPTQTDFNGTVSVNMAQSGYVADDYVADDYVSAAQFIEITPPAVVAQIPADVIQVDLPTVSIAPLLSGAIQTDYVKFDPVTVSIEAHVSQIDFAPVTNLLSTGGNPSDIDLPAVTVTPITVNARSVSIPAISVTSITASALDTDFTPVTVTAFASDTVNIDLPSITHTFASDTANITLPTVSTSIAVDAHDQDMPSVSVTPMAVGSQGKFVAEVDFLAIRTSLVPFDGGVTTFDSPDVSVSPMLGGVGGIGLVDLPSIGTDIVGAATGVTDSTAVQRSVGLPYVTTVLRYGFPQGDFSSVTVNSPTAKFTTNAFGDAEADFIVRQDTVTFNVTVQNNKFYIDGVEAPKLDMQVGTTYIFNTAPGYPMAFSQSPDGAQYTSSSISGLGYQLIFTPTSYDPSTLYYYGVFDSGFGGEISIAPVLYDNVEVTAPVTEISVGVKNIIGFYFNEINSIEVGAGGGSGTDLGIVQASIEAGAGTRQYLDLPSVDANTVVPGLSSVATPSFDPVGVSAFISAYSNEATVNAGTVSISSIEVMPVINKEKMVSLQDNTISLSIGVGTSVSTGVNVGSISITDPAVTATGVLSPNTSINFSIVQIDQSAINRVSADAGGAVTSVAYQNYPFTLSQISGVPT